MLIREWKITDLDAIIKLLTQMNEALSEDQELEESNIREHFVKMEEQKDTYENYVLEEEQKIIGYMSLLFYRSLYHKEDTAQVNELIIDKEYRNKGLGKELLQYGIKRAQEREMDEIEIGVEKENIKAIKFYKDNGIEEEYLLLGKEFE
jgi:ribosomal protein S18 acetylase RimI-like enzyme